MYAKAVSKMTLKPSQAFDLGCAGVTNIDYFYIPVAEKRFINSFRSRIRKGHKLPPHGWLTAPSLNGLFERLIVDITGRNKKCSVERPQGRNSAQIGGQAIVYELH